jgi:protein TonB
VLLIADRHDDDLTESVMPSPSPVTETAIEPIPSGGRYGDRRRPNIPALVIAVLIPALAVAALLQGKITAGSDRERPRLVVLDLSPPPPPPPPPAAKPPPARKAVVVAPVPLLQVPRPAPVMPVALQAAPVAPPVTVPAPPAPPTPPSKVKAADLSTHVISAVPPRYPTESRRRHEQGTVVLGLTLDLNGKVADISVVHSSGYRRLDEAALRAVRKWRWAPTLRDGQPAIVHGQVEIPFVLTT